ncbi:hypothetical protein [Acetobacter pasteurianus]|uniref:Uncharacterized protein n=1 Tax=Acetobacter pasteurianus NBRC 3188 TaxID=1226663 RepID=A0A401WU32_ACEPA|nr:hypothetical protein [Acetobacter pasteurianus]GCD52770.1 hypothetical protein NBRC3188_1467 [Acetobacter pasteurianus NBRC 3188]
MYEDQEMREEIRSCMKGRIRFNVATDRIEVIIGEPDELLRWEPINRLTMLQHLPPSVVERLWDMFADAAGAGFYAEDRLVGIKYIGLHRVAEYLEGGGRRPDRRNPDAFALRTSSGSMGVTVLSNRTLLGENQKQIIVTCQRLPSAKPPDTASVFVTPFHDELRRTYSAI